MSVVSIWSALAFAALFADEVLVSALSALEVERSLDDRGSPGLLTPKSLMHVPPFSCLRIQLPQYRITIYTGYRRKGTFVV